MLALRSAGSWLSIQLCLRLRSAAVKDMMMMMMMMMIYKCYCRWWWVRLQDTGHAGLGIPRSSTVSSWQLWVAGDRFLIHWTSAAGSVRGPRCRPRLFRVLGSCPPQNFHAIPVFWNIFIFIRTFVCSTLWSRFGINCCYETWSFRFCLLGLLPRSFHIMLSLHSSEDSLNRCN